jgi:hypothetical protein
MTLQDAIAATAELCGAPLSKPALAMLALDLDPHPPQAVMAALRRCRMEHRGRLTAEAVISRIDDGRPGAEEAWAMIPRDEDGTVVWTDEMAAAYGIAAPLLAQGEPIAARMAFLEHYRAAVAKARLDGVPVRWRPSFGRDPRDRERALAEAADKGRIARDSPLLLQHVRPPEPPLTAAIERRGPTRAADLVPASLAR